MNRYKKNIRPKGKVIIFLLLIIAGLAGGYFWGRYSSGPSGASDRQSEQEPQTWFCSMHPQIKQDRPGLCPICNMDLIPLESGNIAAGPGEISFSRDVARLMDLETAIVERRAVEAEVYLAGRVSFDQTRVKNLTAWAAGRIEAMYVDFTGIRVIKDDHMVKLFSPELNTAIAEYSQAAATANRTDSSDMLRNSARANMAAAREKLVLMGLSQKQIDHYLQNGPEDGMYVTINSPEDGIVIEKHKNQGDYVKAGDKLYTIADLSRLWIILDAYESDLSWLHYGHPVSFSTTAYPGETFEGKISFISPTVDPLTRTVKVRLNVDNGAGQLKPDMFVKATVRSKVAASGMIMDSTLADKWICPMHPSVVKDDAGSCDICQMPLVTTLSLGYTSSDQASELPLVIPATAPLITGKRAVVYVETISGDVPVYSGREVVLGPRVGQWYQVRQGLSEGERVVISGNFKIDSALQIQAESSMMNPGEKSAMSAQPGQQTLCPVMGGPIDEQYFIEYKGKKVYFCCPGCDKLFLAEPEKYLDKLPQFKSEQEQEQEQEHDHSVDGYGHEYGMKVEVLR